MPEAPVIETERLRLRPHTPADLNACTVLWSDPVVTRYTSGRAFSREEVWARLLRHVGHWSLFGYGFWVVEDKGSSLLVGEIGFAEFERDLSPPLDAPEAGWVLSSQMHGKGYGTESLRAALAWADGRIPRTVCIIHPDNGASLRVAEKCGYREVRRGSYKEHPVVVSERKG